jgi:predicted HTH domain antitoxin
MSISFALPQDLELLLWANFGDLGETARESMAVELYQHGQLTHNEVARILNVSR